jgi:hypothetical protein
LRISTHIALSDINITILKVGGQWRKPNQAGKFYSPGILGYLGWWDVLRGNADAVGLAPEWALRNLGRILQEFHGNLIEDCMDF